MVKNYDVVIDPNESSYTFPTRAVGNAVRDVVLVDGNGNEIALNNLMREYIKTVFPYSWVPSVWSFGMYLTGNEINLYNTLVQSYTAYKLRFITERRPGVLTLSSNCGQVTNITGNIVTLSYVDPTWDATTTFDIINPLPPFQSIQDDQALSAPPSGFQLTFTSIPNGLAKGMWVCPAMTSCIPQIPYEWFPLLTERTVATIAEALDASQLLAGSQAKIEKFEANALSVVKPRITGSVQKIVNRDNTDGYGYGWGSYNGFR